MRALTLTAAAASFATGVVLVRLAPAGWRIEPWQGVLLGSALYMGVLHRWIAWRDADLARLSDTVPARNGPSRDWRLAGEVVWRVAVFLALVAGQAYAYYEWLPATDLRAPFVMLSGWIVAESTLAPRGAGRRFTGSLPRA